MSSPNDSASHNAGRVDYQETPDITEVHAAVQREKPEPSAEVTPMPLWLTGVCTAAMVWAGVYFGVFMGGLSGNVYNEYESSPAVLFPLPETAGKHGAASAAPEQTLAQQGKGVFGQCVACHQTSGQGVAGQYPPLVGSDWVVGSEKRLVAILLKGLQGPLTVSGKPFSSSNQMPAWEGALSARKIAAVASYVRQEWGNKAPEVSEAKVLAAKKEFSAQSAPWTQDQLLKIPADAALPDQGGGAPAPPPGAPAPAVSDGQSAKSTAANVSVTPDLTAEGKANYASICVACHQPSGMGLPGAFPPLAKSEYVNGDPKRFAAIVLKGVAGPITVDGKPFNNVMPGQEAVLTDKKIAGILSYVRASFGNASPSVAPEVVTEARKEFSSRSTPWTEEELKSFASGAAPK